jgi:hypothetical protein
MISAKNLLRSQSDGTTSHSTRSPKNGNQVAGYAASRARSLLAYPFDMSRRSLRGSLHLGLLATVLWGN